MCSKHEDINIQNKLVLKKSKFFLIYQLQSTCLAAKPHIYCTTKSKKDFYIGKIFLSHEWPAYKNFSFITHYKSQYIYNGFVYYIYIYVMLTNMSTLNGTLRKSLNN